MSLVFILLLAAPFPVVIVPPKKTNLYYLNMTTMNMRPLLVMRGSNSLHYDTAWYISNITNRTTNLAGIGLPLNTNWNWVYAGMPFDASAGLEYYTQLSTGKVFTASNQVYGKNYYYAVAFVAFATDIQRDVFVTNSGEYVWPPPSTNVVTVSALGNARSYTNIPNQFWRLRVLSSSNSALEAASRVSGPWVQVDTWSYSINLTRPRLNIATTNLTSWISGYQHKQ